ncbi:MAG: protein kinase [Clostridia bacterium]|nr:protein kinase [Clostridia bacterium]
MEQYEKFVGAVLDGRYKIDCIIGIGGMAVVFRAYDMLMNRVVAIKMLKNEIANDEESVKRFINESKAVAMMSHPNIVSIYDVNVREDIKYIAMEYVEGITLKNYMNRRGSLTLREIISYTEQILKALNHAHSKGVIHRDIKPQNIMLLKSGLVKVTDFGIAKLPNAETVTMTDKAIGTVYYISPEQASGVGIDTRSDLYSLGVMMYEMATGTLPFTADSPVSVAMMQINDTPKAPTEINPSIPRGLEQIIGIAMEKHSDDRYQNAKAMLAQLQALKENPNIVFKMPKKKPSEQDESGSFLSLLLGNGPMFPIIAGVSLTFIILFSICGIYVFNQMMNASKTTAETITVPNFTGGMYSEDLQSWFDASDIYKVTVEYVYNDKSEAGIILEQDPQPDSKRKVLAGQNYCDVTLTVSRGADNVTVPDLKGVDSREARLRLKNLDLKMVVEDATSEVVSVGQVISTNPEKGTSVKVGDTVTVYICSGIPEGQIEIPDFVGMTEKEAFLKIIELDLRPGTIIYRKDDAPAGTILSQTLAAESKVIAKSEVDLEISGGPKYDPQAENPFEGVPETTEPETTVPEEPETSAPEETTLPPKDETTKDETTKPEETTKPKEETTDPTDKPSKPEDTTTKDPVDATTAPSETKDPSAN